MITHGNYKAKAIKASVQLGESTTGSLQIFIDLDLKDASGVSLGQMTTMLYFTEGAAVYSWERLRALGWKGQGPDDIDSLTAPDGNGLYDNEVDARVTQPDQYKATDGTIKTGTSKVEIVTGGAGKVTMAKSVDAATFKARLKALAGGGGSTAPVSGGGGSPPPF